MERKKSTLYLPTHTGIDALEACPDQPQQARGLFARGLRSLPSGNMSSIFFPVVDQSMTPEMIGQGFMHDKSIVELDVIQSHRGTDHSDPQAEQLMRDDSDRAYVNELVARFVFADGNADTEVVSAQDAVFPFAIELASVLPDDEVEAIVPRGNSAARIALSGGNVVIVRPGKALHVFES